MPYGLPLSVTRYSPECGNTCKCYYCDKNMFVLRIGLCQDLVSQTELINLINDYLELDIIRKDDIKQILKRIENK